MRQRIRYMNRADKQKEHQSEQGGRQANELPHREAGSGREQRASDKIGPEQVHRDPGWDHRLDKSGAAEMLGREYGERGGNEYAAQKNELVPAASGGDLFSKYKKSCDKIDESGKTHPEIA